MSPSFWTFRISHPSWPGRNVHTKLSATTPYTHTTRYGTARYRMGQHAKVHSTLATTMQCICIHLNMQNSHRPIHTQTGWYRYAYGRSFSLAPLSLFVFAYLSIFLYHSLTFSHTLDLSIFTVWLAYCTYTNTQPHGPRHTSHNFALGVRLLLRVWVWTRSSTPWTQTHITHAYTVHGPHSRVLNHHPTLSQCFPPTSPFTLFENVLNDN